MRRVIIIFSLLAVVATAVAIVNLRRNADKLDVDWRIKKRLPTKEVEVEHPRRAEIVQTVTAPGTIELVEEADIASQIMGQVDAVLVEKGDTVKEGDLLVRLNGEDASARLASTEARIERLKAAIDMAQADLDKAQLDAAGYHKLESRGFSTPDEVRNGETTLTKMEAVLEMSRHELKESFAMRRNSEQEVERTEIRSPMDGTVIDLDVEVGEVVIAGTTNLPGTVLMTIGDMSKMRVRADVDETDVGLIRHGQPVQIYLQADQTVSVPGQVDLISPKGTKINDVVTFETLIAVKGKHGALRPEMTATVEIEVKRVHDAMSVPVQAVVHRRFRDLPDTPQLREWVEKQPKTPAEKGKDLSVRYIKIVFVMQDGVARVRPVRTGISDEERIEIIEGLDGKDDVIIGPFRTLDEMAEDQPVELKKEDPKKAKKQTARDSKRQPPKTQSPKPEDSKTQQPETQQSARDAEKAS